MLFQIGTSGGTQHDEPACIGVSSNCQALSTNVLVFSFSRVLVFSFSRFLVFSFSRFLVVSFSREFALPGGSGIPEFPEFSDFPENPRAPEAPEASETLDLRNRRFPMENTIGFDAPVRPFPDSGISGILQTP